MRYVMLLWPHANARYRDAIEPLAERELLLTLTRAFPDADPDSFNISFSDCEGTRYLAFSMPEESVGVFARLRGHSALLMLFRIEGELWRPICGPEACVLGEDLSGILKYKGKTNERFTRLLLNMAFLSLECQPAASERLVFVDPLCGKGTSVFEALNRGWTAYGSDIASADVNEGYAFFKKYLEYHRVKHSQKAFSMTVPPSGNAQVRSVQPAVSGEARFAVCDVNAVPYVFGKAKTQIIASDMPYGVQHAPGSARGMDTIERLAGRLFAVAGRCLVAGGVAAISFNVNTLSLAAAREQAARAGLVPLTGGPYDGLAHWVEQAVTRDVCVAVKRGK